MQTLLEAPRETAIPETAIEAPPQVPKIPLPRAETRQPVKRRGWLRAAGLLAAPVAAIGLGLMASTVADPGWPFVIGFALAVAGIALGILCRAGALRPLSWPLRWLDVARNALLVAGTMLLTAFGLIVALLMILGPIARGRQLRRRGRVLLPPVEPGTGWTGVPIDCEVPAHLRAPLAAQWRENGRTEHASVAAFARLTLDLVVLGAPAELIHAAQRDSRDEVRHAELCFSLARALDGGDLGPGRFPQASRARTLPRNRTLALARLAVDSLIDGALHEGVSARVIARLGQSCDDPATRAVLRELAADEGRHAAHGWDVVRWCIAEGGRPVRAALLGALRAIPARVHSALPAAAASGSWERWGIPGRDLEAAEHAAMRAEVLQRVRALAAVAAVAARPVAAAAA